MRNELLIALLALSLSGCAASPPATTIADSPAKSDDFVSIVGTPFLLVLKVPACLASAVLSGPIVGASILLDNDQGREAKYMARETIKQTCGPPYVASP